MLNASSCVFMIQLRSILKVADNSGAIKVQCFKVLGGSVRRYGQLGDIIVVSVREVSPRKAVKKKEVHKAVIVRQRQSYRRPDGSYIRFSENAVVILDGKDPKASRVFGPIAKEVKEKGFTKIASMAEDLV